MEEFHNIAGNVALDFVNTFDNRYAPEGPIELLPTYDRFLSFAREVGIITRPQVARLLGTTSARGAAHSLKRVIELREAMYILFQSVATRGRPDESSLRTFNRFLIEVRVPEALVWQNSEFARKRYNVATTVEGPLRPIIDAATELLTSQDRHRVRECCVESCRWLFIDHSKNHSRRWCDMRVCGNRVKAERFQARQRGEY